MREPVALCGAERARDQPSDQPDSCRTHVLAAPRTVLWRCFKAAFAHHPPYWLPRHRPTLWPPVSAVGQDLPARLPNKRWSVVGASSLRDGASDKYEYGSRHHHCEHGVKAQHPREVERSGDGPKAQDDEKSDESELQPSGRSSHWLVHHEP